MDSSTGGKSVTNKTQEQTKGLFYGVSSDIGNKSEQQDEPSICLDILPRGVHLFAVFDGHGSDGHKVSRYAAKHIKRIIQHEIGPTTVLDEKDNAWIQQAMCKVFQTLHQDIMDQESIDSYMSGTTAVVALLSPWRIVCAGVGDSAACVVKSDGTTVHLTVEHTCANPAERKRVESCGGRVEKTDTSSDAPLRIFKGSLPYPGIVVSRTIGDAVATKVGVISEPDVHFHAVDLASDKYLILGSDGVWDGLGLGSMGAISPSSSSSSTPFEPVQLLPLLNVCSSAQAASDALTSHSLRGMNELYFDDNTTNIVIFLQSVYASAIS